MVAVAVLVFKGFSVARSCRDVASVGWLAVGTLCGIDVLVAKALHTVTLFSLTP